MASFGNIILDSLKFSIQPKRWLQFFVIDAIFLLAIIALFVGNMTPMMDLLLTATTSVAAATSIVGYFLLLLVGFIIWSFVKLYFVGAIVHQSSSPKEKIGKSLEVSKQRYLSLLAVSIVIGLITTAVSIVPLIGWILAIIVGLIFFFVVPSVIVKKLSFDNSMRDSYQIFKKKKVDVFFIWLATAIIGIVIVGIFAIPGLFVILGVVAPLVGQLSATTMLSIVMINLLTNIWILVGAAFILLVGLSISNVFVLKATTDFYLEIKKKKFGIF